LTPPHRFPEIQLLYKANTFGAAICDRGSHWLRHVRFGSEADICSAKGHVRFTPNSDRECRHPQKVMSAFPPKADMCTANTNVR